MGNKASFFMRGIAAMDAFSCPVLVLGSDLGRLIDSEVFLW
jgi:hypothetical protein